MENLSAKDVKDLQKRIIIIEIATQNLNLSCKILNKLVPSQLATFYYTTVYIINKGLTTDITKI